MVPRPDVDHILLLGPTRRHHKLTLAVYLRVLVEVGVDVLLPAAPSTHLLKSLCFVSYLILFLLDYHFIEREREREGIWGIFITDLVVEGWGELG